MKTGINRTIISPLLPAIMLALVGVSVLAADTNQPSVYREFFVSPAGSDTSGSGSKESLFKTLEKARDAVRTVIPNMTGDIVVTIGGGNYPVTQTCLLYTSDAA